MFIGVMTEKPKPVLRGNTVVFVPKLSTLGELVRRLAANSDNIKWSDRALERMAERGITDVMALDVLRFGDAIGLIEPGKNAGEWKVKMTRAVKGRREAGVAVLTVHNAHLLVKTVEWEDLK
jgi:hypothetical protein